MCFTAAMLMPAGDDAEGPFRTVTASVWEPVVLLRTV